MNMQVKAFRRTLAAGAVWAAAMGGLLAASPSASGQESVEPGRGNAYAQGVKVDPRSGRLSFGITYGMALAGHQNTIAIAEARSADLGTIGTTLAAQSCTGGDPTLPKEDQPQPLEARSNEEGAGEEQVGSEHGVERRVVASTEPYARAVATAAGGGDPAAFEIGGTTSVTESGIVDGKRLARARTEVQRLAFGGGQVVLKGLRWEAVYQTAPTEEASGSFTIDGLEIAGERIPLPEDNPAAALEEANAALEPLGFRLRIPAAKTESGIQFVDPLRISVIPSTTRETALGPVFNTVSPVRESVFDAIIEADCRSASLISVLDIVLNSITGAGSLNLEIGGVTATSDDIELTSFLGGLGGAPSLPPLPQGTTGGASGSLGSGGTGSSLGTPGTPGTPGTAADPGSSGSADESGGEELADATPISATGSRGGALAGVGLGGLAMLAALAAADRQKMRKAQRSVLLESF